MDHGRFLQIHSLTSYPPSLLNRDDVGFAKRMPFGGVTRTRVSSQCLKRHWRTHRGPDALSSIEQGSEAIPMAVRSRRTFEQQVYEPLIGDGVPENVALEVTQALMELVLGKSAKAKKASDDNGGGPRTGQVTVLGRPEVDFLLTEAREVCKLVDEPKNVSQAVKDRFGREAKQNLQQLKHGAGLDAALFGRMITSDILARTDAAVHVAHAITVHAEDAETDYFSAVDDLLATSDGDEQLGSGHIGTTELTSGLFYGYVAVDLPLLVSNLEGVESRAWEQADRGLAAEVVGRLIKLIATVSPGAKLGSTAPYARAHLILAESGSAQPRALTNAFLKPVAKHPDLVDNAYSAMSEHLASLDSMYGIDTDRAMAAIGPAERFDTVVSDAARMPLAGVLDWARRQVGGG